MPYIPDRIPKAQGHQHKYDIKVLIDLKDDSKASTNPTAGFMAEKHFLKGVIGEFAYMQLLQKGNQLFCLDPADTAIMTITTTAFQLPISLHFLNITLLINH